MKKKIGIIGLGYVGLPLAVEFAKKYNVVGFDINEDRVNSLKSGNDSTLEISNKDLIKALKGDNNKGLLISNESKRLKDCNVYIVTVPTPVDKSKRPILTPLIKASETIGKVLKKGDIVVYESTVYPGVTEEECAPILEKVSGLKFNKDFYCGYSPERINPGDKIHTIAKIKKVTSGSTKEIGEIVNNLYASIITAGTHLAPSIKVAEAAKVIENAQRDINIAFVNELAKIFNKLNIDTQAVLEAAATKWNFLPFKPGLVGGHCIGVDPYYLAHKAQEVGYHPEIILAGRRLNDSMGEHVATQVLKLMAKKGVPIKATDVLILGITFKENCPDIRNTRVIDVYDELIEFGLNVDIYDTFANKKEVKEEHGIELVSKIDKKYKVIILAVAHKKFETLNWKKIIEKDTVVFDLKGFLPQEIVTARL